ncbi:hypothetical protein H0H93_001988 [Arthromyces matolae]|nr:hypothetical protein H0H93_001988 [Arthromyces matolae]
MPASSSQSLPSSPQPLHISQSGPEVAWPWTSAQSGNSILRPSNIPSNRPNDFALGFNGRDRTPSYQTDSESSTIISHIQKLTQNNKQLHKDLKSLKNKLTSTQSEVSEIVKMIREMNTLLRERDTSPDSTSLLPVPALDKEDYPDIKFWTAKLYRAAKKARQSITSLGPAAMDPSGNVMTWYVETEDGDPVGVETVQNIRTLARTIWHELHLRDIAPATWAEAGLVAMNYFEHHMCRRFPQLSYGENNWKCHMIATDNYSSWRSKHHLSRKAKHQVKEEPKATASDSIKRPATFASDSEREAKRARQDSGSLSDIVIHCKNSIFTDPEEIAKLVVPPSTSTLAAASTSKNVDSTSKNVDSATTSPTDSESPSAPTTATTDTADANTIAPTPTIPMAATPIIHPATAPSGPPSIPPWIAATATAVAVPVKTSKKAKAGQAMNAKSICKRQWIARTPNGTEEEFAKHWLALGLSGQKEFELRASEAKSKPTAKTGTA